MRITLDDLRLYFGDRKSDVLSAVGVGALAGLIFVLSRLTGNGILEMMALVNFGFLWVPLGSLLQKRRAEARWKQAGLDEELLAACEKLSTIDYSLDEYVDTVLSVYTTIYDLSRQNTWFQASADFQEHLASVRDGVLAFFQRAERVNELRKVYDRCAESLRRPGRLASLQARVDKEYKLLEGFADAFEGALLDFSEAIGAAMSTANEEAITEQLHAFAGSMRQLTQSIDEMETNDELAEVDPGQQFERLLGEQDALAFDESAPSQSVSVGGGPQPPAAS